MLGSNLKESFRSLCALAAAFGLIALAGLGTGLRPEAEAQPERNQEFMPMRGGSLPEKGRFPGDIFLVLGSDKVSATMYYWSGSSWVAASTDITSITADVATNTADIATNTADIATNTADIATNAAAIAANTNQLAFSGGELKFATGVVSSADLLTGAGDYELIAAQAGKWYAVLDVYLYLNHGGTSYTGCAENLNIRWGTGQVVAQAVAWTNLTCATADALAHVPGEWDAQVDVASNAVGQALTIDLDSAADEGNGTMSYWIIYFEITAP